MNKTQQDKVMGVWEVEGKGLAAFNGVIGESFSVELTFQLRPECWEIMGETVDQAWGL